ncbi:hypothetical protein VTK26DRAFT_824 [Humicola hyalothermophila]
MSPPPKTMRSFNPFSSVSGKHACTLFEIRLPNDFIVFRGNDHEASGQLLQGTVVLCLSAPLKIEDIHLKLTGTVHYFWTDVKVTATGLSTTKIDKSLDFFEHRWEPFVGIGAQDRARGLTLQPGNYEWPFELMLNGDTTESVEGMREASITYKLKATITRGLLAHDLRAYKRLRVIRTLEASALEFLHAMSVENIWPNKIEYSIVVPQKAVVFGSQIPVEMRFTPLLKGLELGDITIKLIEVHNIILQTHGGAQTREHKKEREVDSWVISPKRDEHWQDMIDETGQEGWVMNQSLNLPKKLGKCLQDVNAKGIKIRHRLKLVVALINPDGHISELRATLPVMIFISPNMPLDEEGNLIRQLPNGASREAATMAPPGYGEHVLDQLYDDLDPVNIMTPIGGRSGVSSPLRAHSRTSSAENLAAMIHGTPISPALLSSRLQSMSLEQHHRPSSWYSNLSEAGVVAGLPHTADSNIVSPPMSVPVTRRNSGEGSLPESATPAEHIDFPEISELSKVPSYQTAVRTPVTPLNLSEGVALPDYQTAMSAPASPLLNSAVTSSPAADPLDTIDEGVQQEPTDGSSAPHSPTLSRRSTLRTPRTSSSLHFPHAFHMTGEGDESRRVQLLQARDRAA